MNINDRAKLATQLLMHEGLRLRVYRDTKGYRTIGVGFNLDARGVAALEALIGRKFSGSITREEALAILNHDIEHFEAEVRRRLPVYEKFDAIRQRVIVDMAFNLGYKSLRFEKAIAALNRGDFATCGREMRLSKWSTDVGDGPGGKFDRADRLIAMMTSGRDYES